MLTYHLNPLSKPVNPVDFVSNELQKYKKISVHQTISEKICTFAIIMPACSYSI